MKRTIISILAIIMMVSCQKEIRYDLVIKEVGFFDGNKDRGVVNIGINADTIAIISKETLTSDSILNAEGKYIIPGLINGHTHVSSKEQLKEGYKYGILANLNMHTGLEDREVEWKKLTRDSIFYPYLFGAGHAATVPNGHPTGFSPDMETINDSVTVKEWVDHRISKGVDYIKVVKDNHSWMDSPAPPTLSYEKVNEIIQYAKSKGLKTVVHATSMQDILAIAKFNPAGFVHMVQWQDELPISEDDYKELAATGVFVNPNGALTLQPTDGMPPAMKSWIEENTLSIEQAANEIRKLHENGIVLITGTDAPNANLNFGDDIYLDLEMFKRAGLTNLEILKTATGNPSNAFEIPIGKLHVGSKLNMLLLNGNPIENIENLKSIEKIWKTPL